MTCSISVPCQAPGPGLTLDGLVGPVQLLGDQAPLGPFGLAAAQGALDGEQLGVGGVTTSR